MWFFPVTKRKDRPGIFSAVRGCLAQVNLHEEQEYNPMAYPELSPCGRDQWDWKSEYAQLGDEKSVQVFLLLWALWLCRPLVPGIHMAFANETQDEIITLTKQAAGKYSSLWFRESRLQSLLSFKYVIWKKIIAQFFSCVFLCKHRVSDFILVYTPTWALCSLEVCKMPKGYIISMTKEADCKLRSRHWLYNFILSFS